MESEAALGPLPAASIGEIESQGLQDQSSNDVVRSFGVENGNALHISKDDHPITLPLSSPEEIFTNPSTYSREETIDCIQRGVGQFWADDLAAQQMNAGTNMQNPPQEQNSSQEQSPPQEQSSPQEQNSPHAPSATPEIKPIPQAKEARGVKRTRASEPDESRAAKRPTRRKRQPATKKAKSKEPRRFPKLLPKPPQPASHWNGTVIPGIQRPYGGSWQRQTGIDPRGVAYSGNASVYMSSPMLLQLQGTTRSMLPTPVPSPGQIPYPRPPQQQGTTRSMLPTPVPSPGQIPYPMPPPQQLANEMTMGSMGHHQPEGNGIPVMYVPPSFSVGHIQPRGNGNAMMHQYDGPMVNASSSFMDPYSLGILLYCAF
ncbi:hypothetical protein BFJ72_g4611 [Fusarium proliferatum]|uniref:Uncharacterized protein n=1 Tax=Gibberella intermedia TaxID=948311 RepID=A0A420TP16_GIBIN|nr:hypothetical protein BFJ72_g4611 [Fusarium proliferatum]